MEAMIKNDEEKVWMTPLLELRNELDSADDRDLRDFRRMNGHVQLFHDRTDSRALHQRAARTLAPAGARGAARGAAANGPAEFRNLQLITLEELHEIRRHLAERETRVRRQPSAIYRRGDRRRSSPGTSEDNALQAEDWELLAEVCGGDQVFFDLQVALLGVEQSHRGMSRRAGIFEKLEKRLRAGIYSDEQEAVDDLTTARGARRKRGHGREGEGTQHVRPWRGSSGC